jgi:CHAT domain-containing protein
VDARPAKIRQGSQSDWNRLPGTVLELDAITRLASGHEIIRLNGSDASSVRLLQELPRSYWAHIATHGFFADPSVPSGQRPDPQDSGFSRDPARISADHINALVLSGIVLAGANLPRIEKTIVSHDDQGILTAEAIAGLPLQDLELVVLSACETGLGKVAGGEGVFGLQRAFHLAGAHNVIASLWRVDDQATAALMAILYDQLWRQNKPPIEALRNAQLAMYHHPQLVSKLAAARGTPEFDKLVQRPEPSAETGREQGADERTLVRQWAAFVLSGWGR